MKSFLSITFCSLTTLISCGQKENITNEYLTFPSNLQEVSGIYYDQKDQAFWSLQDSGNKSELYKVNAEGQVIHTLKITNQENIDWEELTADTDGNLYIGDFGDNKNSRNDLRILKIDKDELQKEATTVSEVITFEYPERPLSPSKKSELLYDAEAFILYQDNFYIFTKNRSKDFDGTSLVYKIPNKPGHHKALLTDTFQGCNTYKHCAITGAALSPDEKTIVLLSHSKIWTIEGFTSDNILGNTTTEHDLLHDSQKESIAFKDTNTLYIADEVKKGTGGKIYQVDLSALKAKP